MYILERGRKPGPLQVVADETLANSTTTLLKRATICTDTALYFLVGHRVTCSVNTVRMTSTRVSVRKFCSICTRHERHRIVQTVGPPCLMALQQHFS